MLWAGLILMAMTSDVPLETITYSLSAIGASGETVLAEGTRTYSPVTDVEVERNVGGDGIVFWSKRVDLAKGYKLEANVHREASVDGFGLVVTNPSNPGEFSWNWFDREDAAVFAKRRGSGRLRVTLRDVAGLKELEAVEFSDDVVLTYSEDMHVTKPGERTHVLLIKKGSVFRMAH